MWHEKESMLELQAAGLAEEGIAQLEEKIEARQHGTGYLGAHLNGRQPGKLSPAGSCEPQVRRAGSVVNLGRHATTEQTILWRAQQEESGRAQDSVLGGAQEGSRSAKRARHAYPEVRPHHRLYHHLLPEELSSNLLPEGCATNVDSTWSQGLDLTPALGDAASQGREASQGSAAVHAPAVCEGGVVSQEQHEAALAAARALSVPLRRRMETQAAAAETELLKLSFAHAVKLREARGQHERSATTAQQQHDHALAALRKQLVEREAATEKALLEASASRAAALVAAQENDKLREAVAAANLRAGEAEAQARAAEARAALVLTALEPPWAEAEPEPASPPPESSSASSSSDSGASRSDVGDSGDVGDSAGSGDDGPSDGAIPEDAFMQRCQQQIARIVAASSGDGVETQLPMLSRMGQLPPGAHMRRTGAHLRLASSLNAVIEPRTLASDTAYESRNGRKRDWQVTGGEVLPHTATWHNGSAAKFAKPDDWVPAAPKMLQPDLLVALGELAGARNCCRPFPHI